MTDNLKKQLGGIFDEETIKSSFVFVIVLCSYTAVPAVANIRAFSFSGALARLSYILLSWGLFVLICPIGSKLCNRILRFVFFVTFMSWHTCDLFSMIHYGAEPQPEMLYLIRASTGSEVKGFILTSILNWKNLVLLIPVLFAVSSAAVRKNKLFFYLALPLMIAVFPCLAVLGLNIQSSTVNNEKEWMCPFLDFADNSIDYFLERQASGEALKSANKNIEAECGLKEITAVLIVGEAHAKSHSGLYGYRRNTNPKLAERLKRKNGFYYFTNVVASNSLTIYSVTKILSFYAHNSEKSFEQYPDLISLYKKAGFLTCWITNQPSDNKIMPYRVITANADIKMDCANAEHCHDFNLIPKIDGCLKMDHPRKLILCHLAGSHHDYIDTYPENFTEYPLDETPDFFTKSQKQHSDWINAYDNSIRYNDYVLDCIISLLEKKGKTAVMLYIPDHGENLLEDPDLFLHSEYIMTRMTAEIPMYIWLSEDLRKEFGSLLENAKDTPFASENVPHLLPVLSHIVSNVMKPEHNMLSKQYIPGKRIVSENGLEYEYLKKIGRESISARNKENLLK